MFTDPSDPTDNQTDDLSVISPSPCCYIAMPPCNLIDCRRGIFVVFLCSIWLAFCVSILQFMNWLKNDAYCTAGHRSITRECG